jgi:hypothetical protein
MAHRGTEKSLAVWPLVENTIKELQEFGVLCERVLSEEGKKKGVTTPTGYLRDKGWVLVMTFHEGAGGFAVLKALRDYCVIVNKKCGKKAFQYFLNVDMSVLKEK